MRPMDVQNKRIVYNDRNLFIYKQREIRLLKRKIKLIKKKYSKKMTIIRDKIKKTKFRKRDLKNLSKGRGLSIFEGKKKQKKKKLILRKKKINWLKTLKNKLKRLLK